MGRQSCTAIMAAVMSLSAPVAWAQEQTGAEPVTTRQAPDRFPVYAIDITGVTRLSSAEIERIIYPHLGPERDNADVEKARIAIQDAYTAKGYQAVLVSLPPQDEALFAQGIVTIAVNEAPVGKVKMTDGKFHDAKGLRDALPAVKEGQPLDLAALQTQLDRANRFPDRRVSPVFVPGDVPGTLDVELNVESDLPLHGSVELNNDNSPSTTRQRFNVSARYTNLWGAGHSISAGYATAPQRQSDSKVFSGSYTAPLHGTPWTLLLFGYKSNSDIAALGGSNVLGNGYQIGARAIYRLPAQSTTQTLSIGLDYKDFKQDIFVGATNAASTPIRYVPLTAEYSLFARDDASEFAKKLGVSDISLTLGSTFGLRAIKRNICSVIVDGQPCIPVDQFRNREFDTFENFVHFNGSLGYSLTTKADIVLALNMAAQLSDSHLVTNEQFAAGGLGSVRGYFQSEAVGDDGISGGLEVQAPSLASKLGKWVDELRLFGFMDAAYVNIRYAQPGQVSSYRLLGAGGGVRLKLLDKFFGEMTLAWPLRDGSDTRKGDERLVFVLRGEF